MNADKKCKLLDVCHTICSGKTPDTRRKEYWENGTISWYTQTDVSASKFAPKEFVTQKAIERFNLPLTTKNSVLLCNVSEAVAFYTGTSNLSFNQQIFLLEPDTKKVKPNFLYYLLCSQKTKLNSLMRGKTVFKSLTKTELKNFPIFLTSFSQQEQILSKFQIIYNKLFESEITYNDFLVKLTKKYLELGDLLFLKYQDSEIKIKEHFRLIRGKTPPTKNPHYYQNGIVKWINSGVLTNFYFLTEHTPASKLITEQATKECNLSFIQSNTVLISGIDFNVGNKIVWNQTNDIIPGTGIYGFMNSDEAKNATLYFAIRKAKERIAKKICLKGARQFTSIRNLELLKFSFPWVSNSIYQKIFFTILNSKLAKIKELQHKIKELLLQKYFNF